MTISRRCIFLKTFKRIFEKFSDKETLKSYQLEELEYNDWRRVKNMIRCYEDGSIGHDFVYIFYGDDDDYMYFSSKDKKETYLVKIPNKWNSFAGFLLRRLEDKEDEMDNTTSYTFKNGEAITVTADNSTISTSAFINPSTGTTTNNYTTGGTTNNSNWYTPNTNGIYNTWTTIPSNISELKGIDISEKGIYINGKKVLTEEDNKMTKDKMFDVKIEFGPLDTPICALSPFGIAIRTIDDNSYCYYDPVECKVVDCTPFTFDTKKFLYKMPVAVSDISVGDIIMHYNLPMFVKGVEDAEGRIVVIDVSVGEEKYILPKRNMFGFNYITKIVSLLDFNNIGASAENPFGNMLPLLMMMGDDNKELDPMMLLMMGGINGSGSVNAFGAMNQNPLMMYLMMKDSKELSKMLPFMLMSNLPQK